MKHLVTASTAVAVKSNDSSGRHHRKSQSARVTTMISMCIAVLGSPSNPQQSLKSCSRALKNKPFLHDFMTEMMEK